MSYGYQEIATILNLQDAKLLRVRHKGFDWNKIKSELRLISEEVKIENPESIHYVFGGMAPISVSLIIRMFEAKGFAAIQKSKYFQKAAHLCKSSGHSGGAQPRRAFLCHLSKLHQLWSLQP